MAITDGYKYIKVNKTDANGLNNSSTLGGMTQLRITFADNTYNDYQIVSLVDNGDYYTFRVTGDECGEKDNNVPSYEDMELEIHELTILGEDINWVWSAINPIYEEVKAAYYWPSTGSTSGFPFDPNLIPQPDEFIETTASYYSLGKTTQPKMKLRATNLRVINDLTDGGIGCGLTCSFAILSKNPNINEYIGSLPNDPSANYNIIGVGRLGEIDAGQTLTFSPTWQVGDVDFTFQGTYQDSLISGSGFHILYYLEKNLGELPDGGEVSFVCDVGNSGGQFSWDNQSPIGITSDATLCIYSPDVISIEYLNSNYNPILNNVSENELNSFTQVVDYDDGISFPSNFTPIINDNAEKAQIPDSFFTQKASILPRYEGCELTSTDYNHYTEGDVSYGKTAVIDSNPIYFAHFTKASPSLEDIGSLEFYLDYLIPVDVDIDENLSNFNQIPGLIKLSGDETFSYLTSHNFQQKRNCAIDFSTDTIQNENDPKGTIEWGSLEDTPHPIVQGGLNFETIISNIAYPSKILNQLIPTESAITLVTGSSGDIIATITNPYYFSSRVVSFTITDPITPVTQSRDQYILTQRGDGSPPGAPSYKQSSEFIMTGSNKLLLGGDGNYPILNPFSMWNFSWVTSLSAPELNNKVQNILNTGSSNKNFFKYKGEDYWNVGSYFPGYKSNKAQFPLEYGDQIQLVSSSGELVTFTINSTSSYLSTLYNDLITPANNVYASTFDVFPNPELYEFTQNPAQNYSYQTGSISLFNIRRRNYSDNRVLLKTPSVLDLVTSGSLTNFLSTDINYLGYGTQENKFSPMGNNISSPSGYLIPSDFSPEQQEKVGKIIAILKGNNVFT